MSLQPFRTFKRLTIMSYPLCSGRCFSASSAKNRVIVIGGGAAGLSAAIEANNLGATVYLMDKQEKIGGNTLKASSGINGCMTDVQRDQGVIDSYDLFVHDTHKAGGGISSEDLVDKLAHDSAEAIKFLQDLGLPLSEVIQLGGHSTRRTHRLATRAPIGFMLVKTLSNEVNKRENIHVLTSTVVNSLLWSSDETGNRRVTGVSYSQKKEVLDEDTAQLFVKEDVKEHTLDAEAVIIASGGSAFDQSNDGLLAEFLPSLRGLPTSSGAQADGGGIRLARQAGASLVDMDRVQLHPTGFVNPADPGSLSKILAPEALRGSGGILVNYQGRRFANELGTRAYLTKAIMEHCAPHHTLLTSTRPQHVGYMILSPKSKENFGNTLEFYMSKGLVVKFDTLQEVCAAHDIPLDSLLDTVRKYSKAACSSSGTSTDGSYVPDLYGKTIFPALDFNESGPYFVAEITPVIHYTLGGIEIDTNAAVLWMPMSTSTSTLDPSTSVDSGNTPVPLGGLYAAGECTGGVHGADRLGGNSLLDCIVYGRQAGISAMRRP